MQYHVFTTGETPVLSRARKDAAIKAAERELGTDASWRITTDSGNLVYTNVPQPDTDHADEQVAEEDRELPDGWDTAHDQGSDPEPAEEGVDAKKAKHAADQAARKAKREQAKEQADEPAAEPIDVEAESSTPAPGSKSFDTAAMKRKIAALLNKAERTDNDAERDAFNAAAERLMLKLGINAAELEAQGEKKAEKIIEQRLSWQSVYAMDLVKVAHRIAAGVGNLTTLQSGRWADATVYVIGHKSDVELAVKLITSVELQMFSALKRWQKDHKAERAGLSNYDKLVGNRSFITGFSSVVQKRLEDSRKVVEAEASTGAALVLASKMDRVNEAVAEMYPKLGKGRAGKGARYSSLAMRDGAQAGKSADLGEKRVGGNKGELA